MELRKDQYDYLLMDYTRKQSKIRRELDSRYDEVSDKIPNYSLLDDEICDISVQATEAALEGDAHAMDNLKSQIQEISLKKKQLLSEHGFPSDYLDAKYDCPDCKDTGFIGQKKCHCFEKRIVDYLYSQSNLKEILQKENFHHFSMKYYPDDYTEPSTGLTPKDNMNNILKTVHEFIDEFDTKKRNLLLYGSTGVGKTFLSHCIAKELLDQSNTVIYLTSLELFDILETYKFDYHKSARDNDSQFSYILDCSLLIIDDLGTELNNAFISSGLYQCIDYRLLRERSTIISTNLSFEDLSKRYSERIFSRITSNYSLLKLTGTDIRIKKALDRVQ